MFVLPVRSIHAVATGVLAATLLLAASASSTVVPAGVFGYGKSVSLAARIGWWAWPVVCFSVSLTSLPARSKWRSVCSAVGSLAVAVSYISIVRALTHWPVTLILAGSKIDLPHVWGGTVHVDWRLFWFSSDTTPLVTLLAVAMGCIDVACTMLVFRWFCRVTQLRLVAVVAVNVALQQLVAALGWFFLVLPVGSAIAYCSRRLVAANGAEIEPR